MFKVTLVPEASGLKIQKMKRGVAEPSMLSFFYDAFVVCLSQYICVFPRFFYKSTPTYVFTIHYLTVAVRFDT